MRKHFKTRDEREKVGESFRERGRGGVFRERKGVLSSASPTFPLSHYCYYKTKKHHLSFFFSFWKFTSNRWDLIRFPPIFRVSFRFDSIRFRSIHFRSFGHFLPLPADLWLIFRSLISDTFFFCHGSDRRVVSALRFDASGRLSPRRRRRRREFHLLPTRFHFPQCRRSRQCCECFRPSFTSIRSIFISFLLIWVNGFYAQDSFFYFFFLWPFWIRSDLDLCVWSERDLWLICVCSGSQAM